MKLNYGQIRAPRFNEVMTKLLHAPMTVKESKRLLDLVYKIREEQQKADELANVLKAKIADEHPTHENEHVKEYLSTEVEFDFKPFDLEGVEGVKLSAADLLLLEGIIV